MQDEKREQGNAAGAAFPFLFDGPHPLGLATTPRRETHAAAPDGSASTPLSGPASTTPFPPAFVTGDGARRRRGRRKEGRRPGSCLAGYGPCEPATTGSCGPVTPRQTRAQNRLAEFLPGQAVTATGRPVRTPLHKEGEGLPPARHSGQITFDDARRNVLENHFFVGRKQIERAHRSR